MRTSIWSFLRTLMAMVLVWKVRDTRHVEPRSETDIPFQRNKMIATIVM